MRTGDRIQTQRRYAGAWMRSLTFTVTPSVEIRTAQLTRAEFPMTGCCVRFILVDLRKFFSRSKHLLEAKQMPVDPLSISCPCGILHVARSGSTKQFCSVFVLNRMDVISQHHAHLIPEIRRLRVVALKTIRTVSAGSSIASAQAFDSLLALRMTSVRPSWNLRVCALSYVTPGRPNIL